jgi:hypothetical protein
MSRTKPRVCPECRQEYKISLAERYRYRESGLDNVYLENVETMSCQCGTAVVLAAVPTLLRVVACCFAFKPARLRGRELRFIRNVLRRSAKDFAEVISFTPEHLSRVENETEGVSALVDKLVRSRIVLELVAGDGAAGLFDLDQFRALVDGKIPEADDSLALFLEYRTSRLGVRKRERVDFEFRAAA